MTDKHTPGPWDRDKYGHIVTPSGDVMFRSLSILASSSDERMAEAEANTTLAAAAPELLEALLEIDARLRRCAIDPISVAEAYDSFYQEIVAEAIAKATGSAA